MSKPSWPRCVTLHGVRALLLPRGTSGHLPHVQGQTAPWPLSCLCRIALVALCLLSAACATCSCSLELTRAGAELSPGQSEALQGPRGCLSLHWDHSTGVSQWDRGAWCALLKGTLELGLWHLLMHFHAHLHSVNKSLERSEAALWAGFGRKHNSAGWKSQQCPCPPLAPTQTGGLEFLLLALLFLLRSLMYLED